MIGGRQIHPENLTLCVSSSGENDSVYADEELVEQIDASGYASRVHFLEVRKDVLSATELENVKSTELNFSKVVVQQRGGMAQQMIAGAIPRYQDFNLTDTIIEMKKKVYERVKGAFKQDQCPEDNEVEAEEWINKNILLNIKDNTPMLRTRN